ncbi:hypothetical protein B0H14DRAFT_2567984 [Mycena olivaceomarginata]|nr:hypothetical protein B0H14DRAFT_2567984 [Mycena olivaceomarginata]
MTAQQAWTRLSWPRICILLVFLDSYLFLFSTGILVFGVGLQLNATACSTGIYLCVLFYTSSKILIYSFLTEKVYIVWDTGRKRLHSPVFLLCMATLVLYGAVLIIMVIGRVAKFREGDGACVIGLKPTASIPLLSYDLFINFLLTALFLWPLMRSRHSNARLRRLAIRTLVAAGMALTTSTVNIAVLTLMHGHQLGWLCLASCGLDVIFNAAALFWVTVGSGQNSLSGSSPNRQLSDALSNSNTLAPSAPTSPIRGVFKQGINESKGKMSLSVPNSPARSAFKQDIETKSGQVFKMAPLSARVKEFQIHVTTQSHMSTSPPDPTELSERSHSDTESK